MPVLEHGIRVWRDMAEVDTSRPAHPGWPERLFGDIVDGYLASTANQGGMVGDARSFLIDGRGLLDRALTVMQTTVR